MSKTDPRHIIEQVLSQAKSAGATAAEADLGSGSGLSVTVRMGETETIEHQRDKSLVVTVYLSQRKGTASTTDFSDKALTDTVNAAVTIAQNASEDGYAGLIDPGYLAQEIPDLDLFHPWDISPKQTIKLAIACEAEARNSDKRINNSDGTVVSTYSGEHTYGNSHGFIGGWHWSSHTIDCTVIAKENGQMQRDGWYSKSRDFADLDDIKAIGLEAARRTVTRLGARKLSTRTVPVIYEAPVAAGLFSALIGAISGSALYRKSTFLLDKKGEQIFPGHVHIREEPHLKKGMGSAPFDNDGMATRAKDIVSEGVLRDYVLSAYSARKLGLQPTGNAGGVHNLIVNPGDLDLTQLLKTMHTGLLITDMIGFGVNQVTGDYSRGASGFWVENGEICYPVEEITVAGNLAEMYKDIIATGSDVDRRGNIQTGSVLIEKMTIAGD